MSKTTSPTEKHIKNIQNKKPSKQANTEAKLEKFLKKNTKILATIKPILNEAASLYSNISKTCPTELATKLQDKLLKQLKLSISPEYTNEDSPTPTKFYLAYNATSKSMPIPVTK